MRPPTIDWEERCDRRLASIMATDRDQNVHRKGGKWSRFRSMVIYRCEDPTVHINPKIDNRGRRK